MTIQGKIFQLKTVEELRVLLKLQLQTSRTIDFFFKELNFMLKGSYEYIFTVMGNINKGKERILFHKDKIFFKRFDIEE